MTFIPDMSQWVSSHFKDVPDQIVSEIGDLNGKSVLDIGCGEMLTSMGLLEKRATSVTALDIKELASIVSSSRAKIEESGMKLNEWGSLIPVQYDGTTMPFEDESFDIVVSWGVAEHITDIMSVLSEIKRVLKRDGVCFIKVFPWFSSYYGSHLSDFQSEPFAHLKYGSVALRKMIEDNVKNSKEVEPSFVLGHMWDEYKTLNKYSANMFYRDVKLSGFSRDIWKITSYQHDLSQAPKGYDLAELMISGTETILYK